jgi:hypothetical protein
LTKNNPWNDPNNYPIFVESTNPYAQYTQSIFSDSMASSDQTQISEYEISESELKKSGFQIAKYFVDRGNRCSKTGYIQKCSCGETNFKPRYGKGSKHKVECPICGRARAKSTGRKGFYLFMAGPHHYVGQLVLTIPEDHPLSYNTFESREKAFENLYALAKRFVDAYFKGCGFRMVVHSWSTKNPLCLPHWHIHVLINLVKFVQGKPIMCSGHRSDLEIRGMRRLWADLLSIPLHDSNLYYNFTFTGRHDRWIIKAHGPDQHIKGVETLRHWCNYDTRTAVCDIDEWLKKNNDPSDLSPDQKEWYAFHVDPIRNNFHRVRWFGGLSNSNRSAYLLKLGSHLDLVKEAIRQDLEESKRLYCWLCRTELNPMGWEWHQGLICRKYFAKSNDDWNRYRDLVT